ncbi:hypothetical protein LIER_33754 [Lithospermum erythrorhizon]|uniref:Uncharacterized protein n=1 Tax=Lithospermum erythrorhizon TaxID=34254 RepID=A0AAV3S2I5_LITER
MLSLCIMVVSEEGDLDDDIAFFRVGDKYDEELDNEIREENLRTLRKEHAKFDELAREAAEFDELSREAVDIEEIVGESQSKFASDWVGSSSQSSKKPDTYARYGKEFQERKLAG